MRERREREERREGSRRKRKKDKVEGRIEREQAEGLKREPVRTRNVTSFGLVRYICSSSDNFSLHIIK